MKSPAIEVVTSYSFERDGAGCKVELSRDYVGGAPAKGALSEALFLGNMSNELAALAQEAASPAHREGTLPENAFAVGIPSAGFGRPAASKGLDGALGPKRLLSTLSSRIGGLKG